MGVPAIAVGLSAISLLAKLGMGTGNGNEIKPRSHPRIPLPNTLAKDAAPIPNALAAINIKSRAWTKKRCDFLNKKQTLFAKKIAFL